MSKKYYTVKQVAMLLGVAVSTVWRWAREGKIKAIRLPSGRYRIPEDEIIDILTPRR